MLSSSFSAMLPLRAAAAERRSSLTAGVDDLVDRVPVSEAVLEADDEGVSSATVGPAEHPNCGS